MRISLNPNSQDYIGTLDTYVVTVDGNVQNWVWSADDEAGEVVCAVCGPGGKFAHDGKNFLLQTLRGNVKINQVALSASAGKIVRSV